MISRRGTLAEMRTAARAAGMHSLREEGERLVAAGRSTPVEVERVLQGAAQ